MSRSPRNFLNDLYRDFRDRGLLIPAGLLVAALIAVPLFLTQSAPPAPSAPQTQQIEATAATPAVLTESVGVRDYRKRLRQLKQKNPFKQQFTGPAGGGGVFELDLDSAGGGGGGDLDPSASDDLDAASGTGSPTDSGAGAARDPDSSSAPADTDEKPQGPDAMWFTWEVDLAFGPLREVERFEGVRVMEFLPSRKNAVAVMAGAGLQGNRVGFMFLPDVVASKGDGRCAPGPRNCTFLVLKKGEQHRVTVIDPEGEEITYRIKVHDITAAKLGPQDFELPAQDD